MKITIARYAGFCFGVRRAIDITFKVRQKNPHKKIYTLGQIIHNPQVIEALKGGASGSSTTPTTRGSRRGISPSSAPTASPRTRNRRWRRRASR